MEGLGDSVHMELLDDALPPTFSDLDFQELTVGFRGNDAAPKRLGSTIFAHLTYFPLPRVAVKDMCCQGPSGAATPVFLEDEELLHPRAFLPGDDGGRYKREANELRTLQGDVRMKSIVLSVRLEVEPIPSLGIRLLFPNVGQLVLVQLQHVLQCVELFRFSLVDIKEHTNRFLLPNV